MSWSTSRHATPDAAMCRRWSAKAVTSAMLEPGGGLVEQQHLRPQGERTGHAHRLLPPERKLGRPALGHVVAAPSGRWRRPPPPTGGGWGARVAQHLPPVAPAVVADADVVLGRRGRRTAPPTATCAPDPCGRGRGSARPLSDSPSSTTSPVDGREAGDGVDERGLPGAVRPDEPDDLAGADVEAHPVDGAQAAVVHGDARRSAGPPRRSPATAAGRSGRVTGGVDRVRRVGPAASARRRRAWRRAAWARPAMPEGLKITVRISAGPLIST